MNLHPDGAPLVSVVIPAFQAHGFIADAVRSIRAQHAAPPFEILVAPDDGSDYSALAALASAGVLRPALRVLPPDGHHGVAHARNRAIAAARGEFIALCDADDLWPANYLQELLPLALAHGIACANTRYTDWQGELLRTPPVAGDWLSLSACGRCLASIRPLWRKTLGIGFHEVFAEDLLHVLHLAALSSTGIPLTGGTHYTLRERRGSLTFQDMQRERHIIAAYTPLIKGVRDTPSALGLDSLPDDRRASIAETLRFWRFANIAYLNSDCKQSFMRFVAGKESALWQDFRPGDAGGDLQR